MRKSSGISRVQKKGGEQTITTARVGVLVAVIYVLIFAGMFLNFDYDFSLFLGVGNVYADPEAVPDNIKIFSNSTGYDGQFYYRLALDPFTNKPTDFGITLDYNGYRQQRVLFPLAAWLLSLGGRPELVPAVMVLINLVAVCALGILAAGLVTAMGRPPFYSLLFALFPGFYFSFRCTLVEPIMACFILVALTGYVKKNFRLMAIMLVLAVLARETAVFLAGGILLEGAIGVLAKKEDSLRKLKAAVVPIAVFVVMQLVMYANWGTWPFREAGGNLGLPLAGFITYLKWHIAKIEVFAWLNHFEIIGIILFSLTVLYLVARSLGRGDLQISWIVYALLVFSLSNYVWVDNMAYLRTMTAFAIIGHFIVLDRGSEFLKKCVFAYNSLLFSFMICYYFTLDAVFFR